MRLRTFAINTIAILFVATNIFGQAQPILLKNPSFEDMPRHSKPPIGWFDCGFAGESPPDVQPSGTFKVTKTPVDGNTYLGMVVRDNDTWESVAQKLSDPIQNGSCYQFSLNLCRSELYVSTSRITDEEANYTTPAKIRIYGGNGYCDKAEVLAESAEVDNTSWKEFSFRFEPRGTYSYIILEAFYKTPTLFPYNGNILIDNASAISPVPCGDEQLVVENYDKTVTIDYDNPVTKPNIPKNNPPSPPSVDRNPPTGNNSEPEVEDYSDKDLIVFDELDQTDLKEGMRINVEQLFFEADKSLITSNSYPILNKIYDFLSQNKNMIVEIGGHTNSLPPEEYCYRLSTDRAKAVVDYLNSKGIAQDRLKYKGYGKDKPVSSNETAEGRRKNQRVEITILSFNG